MAVPNPPCFLDTPPLREGFRYWQSLCSPQGLPQAQELDPVTMPTAILPWMLLYQRTSSSRYLCLRMGAGACCVFGYGPTGRHMDELLSSETYEVRRRLFDECLFSAQPVGYGGHLSLPEKEHISYRRLLLPVCTAQVPDHVFGLIVFPNQNGAALPFDTSQSAVWDASVWRYDVGA